MSVPREQSNDTDVQNLLLFLNIRTQMNLKEEEKMNKEEVKSNDLERAEFDMEWKDNESSDDNSGL